MSGNEPLSQNLNQSHPSDKQINLDSTDLDFVRSTSSAMLEQTPKRSRLLLYTIIIMIIVLLVWAKNAPLDEIARGEGKVIPSNQIQIVQNLEGGIISALLVKEGDKVEKDQILLKIDDTNFESSFMESHFRYLELLAKSARLSAEAEGQDSFQIPAIVLKEAPNLAKNEQALFESHINKLNSNLDILKNKVEQNKQEVTEAESKIEQIDRSYLLAKKELDIITPLFTKGAVSQVDVIKRERQVNELLGELNAVKLSLPRLKSSIREAENKISELIIRSKSEAREELNEISAEIPRILEAIDTLQDKVSRTSVRSPVKGTVKQLLVNTIKGVVQPGMDLVEIVPMNDALLIEAKVKPSDIAYLYPGLKATVRFTAYDFAIYGGLEARVVHISADSISNEKDESFYLVRVKTDKNFLGKSADSFPIIPGMVAQVDIMTGKKTVMDYLLKPILKTRQTALSER